MDLKKIDSNIRRVRTNGTKWNDLVQTTAVAIVEHSVATGDCTRALKLVQAMPMSSRRNLLINWFSEYGNIGMNVKEGKVRLHKPDSKSYVQVDMAAVRANNWFDEAAAEEGALPDTTLLDVRHQIELLAKRLEKKVKDGKVAAADKDNIVVLTTALTKLSLAA